jgi:hypothetical protein
VLGDEGQARTLGGGKIWSAMKPSAELAAASDGGATYVAEKLVKFSKAAACPIELHVRHRRRPRRGLCRLAGRREPHAFRRLLSLAQALRTIADALAPAS